MEAVGKNAAVHLIPPPSIAGLLIPGRMPIPEVLTTLGPHLRLIMIAWPTAALPGRAARVRRVDGTETVSASFFTTQKVCPTLPSPPRPLTPSP